MRNLHDRATLTAALTPPHGYELQHAVGTTFTLDLESALTVPLSLAARGATDASDRLGVLDALRRSADRLDIFAQVGEMRMGTPSDLVVLLEQSIHQVRAPRGLFHPKVWFLQFTRDNGGSRAPSSYFRFLCATRNLTPDRSWDLLVQLDGTPLLWSGATGPGDAPSDHELSAAREKNAPLANLLRALPGLSAYPLSGYRAARIEALAAAWETIEWEMPTETKSVAFHVFGLGQNEGPTPVLGGRNALVISPFLTDRGLARVREGVIGVTHVITRVEALERLDPGSLGSRLHTYVLDDAATLGSEPGLAPESDSALQPAPESAPQHRPTELLSGLHAKALVYDRGHRSHVFIGSANATEAAWNNNNVEVMVEFEARKGAYGVRAMLEGLASFAEPYDATGGAEEPEDERTARQLEHLLRGIAAVPWTAHMTGEGPCALAVWADAAADRLVERLHVEFGAGLTWHLLTRRDQGAAGAPLEANPVTLTDLPLDEVTPFLVLQTMTTRGVSARTIVLARLLSDSDKRRDAVIGRHITDRSSFMRLLTLMLELTGVRLGSAQTGTTWAWSGQVGGEAVEFSGLMEAMVRALGRQPEALNDVRRMIEFVRGAGGTEEIFPDGFDELWVQVEKAYGSTRRPHRSAASSSEATGERSAT